MLWLLALRPWTIILTGLIDVMITSMRSVKVMGQGRRAENQAAGNNRHKYQCQGNLKAPLRHKHATQHATQNKNYVAEAGNAAGQRSDLAT